MPPHLTVQRRQSYFEPSYSHPPTAGPRQRRQSYYDPAYPFPQTPATNHGRPSNIYKDDYDLIPKVGQQHRQSYYDPAYPFPETPATQRGRPSNIYDDDDDVFIPTVEKQHRRAHYDPANAVLRNYAAHNPDGYSEPFAEAGATMSGPSADGRRARARALPLQRDGPAAPTVPRWPDVPYS
jgi:hypothetical protein